MHKTAVVIGLLIAVLANPSRAVAQDALEPTLGVTDDRQGADILGTFADSLRLLLIEHGWRIAFQEKTWRELGGNFWDDYRRSVRIPSQWEDTDAWWMNYIGHPIHGAAAGYLWLDHEPRAPVNRDGWGWRKPNPPPAH